MVVKSKLNILAYKPEVQKTDFTYVYQTPFSLKTVMRHTHMLICHKIRMHVFMKSLLFKDHFQNHWLFSENAIFVNLVKATNSLKFKLSHCFSDADIIHITRKSKLG